ncbi:TolC family protein [Candidatus Borreliella tachyglossi]|uniref:TolC family protein n=1 Tax=Candidatus Borreliella tachyglossi TaxID=1964448 RepID=A0A2S1LW72_9SPIR|nr:TolC family protein [Candidatus Borreliella tachyglossi]AWG42536.1 TolC family protein [Candidatus Borreliella tachyglossi]
MPTFGFSFLYLLEEANIKRLALIFVLVSSYAETMKISPEDAVRMALENNLDSKNAEYKEKIKKLYKDNSWNVFVPNLGASANLSRSSSSIPNAEERDYWGLGFGVSAGFTISPSVLKKIQLTVLDYENAKIDREKAVKNIRLGVLKMYNQLIALKSTLKVFEIQLKNSKLKFEQARISYDNGLLSEIDYLDAKLKYAKAQPALDEQVINFEKLKEGFKLLVGLDALQDFETIGELSDEILDFSLFNEVIDINEQLDVKTLNNSYKIVQKSLDAIWLDTFLPSFSFSLSYAPSISFSSNSSGLLKNGFSASLGLKYNLTEILPFSKSFTNIWDKDYQLEIVKNQVANKIREFKSNIIHKRKDVRKYKSILDASKMNLELARKNYQLAFDSFNAGAIDLLKFNDIEFTYKQSDLQFIRDKLNYSNAILEYKDLISALD